MKKYKVTKKAMRPASSARKCFYCHQPIGKTHKPDCVLVRKRVKVKAIIDYEIEVPHSWDKELIEFARNEGSWCSTNMIDELKEMDKKNGCLCHCTEFECIDETGPSYLDEG